MRIALPKGRLFEGVRDVLAEAGLRFSFASDRDYHPVCSNPIVHASLRKPRAIPQLVALGNFDIGFCGFDLVEECAYDDAIPVGLMGLNRVRLVAAVHASQLNFLDHPPKRPIVIATEYESIAARWAYERGLAAIIIQTYGSTESYAPADADVVFDCVETGATMAANGLVVVDELFASETCVIINRYLAGDVRRSVQWLVDRVNEITMLRRRTS